MIFDGGRVARQDRFDLLVGLLAVGKDGPGDGPRVEVHRDQVGDRLAGVGDSDEQVVGLPGSHRRGVAHGEGEVGIAHQHRPLCMAGELNRAAGQPVEGGGDLELDRLGPLLQPFDGEVGLPAFGRLQLADVVGGAELAVFSGRQHRHGSGEVPIGSLGHAQGVIARIGVGRRGSDPRRRAG